MGPVPYSHQNSTSSQKSEVQYDEPVAPLKKSEVQDDVPVALLNPSVLQLRVTREEKSDVKYEDYEPVMQTLVDWLNENNCKRMGELEKSVQKARSYDIVELKILGITDAKSFLTFANKMLFWVPQETFDGKDVDYNVLMFYFVLNLPPLGSYQTPIHPDSIGQMSWLTRWIVDYAVEIGKFCEKPESLTPESLETFHRSPEYKMGNYIEPRGGWRNFNEFFSRQLKPGYRTIGGLSDPTVIVSPADCTFGGSWNIDVYSEVTLKHLAWNVSDLLQGSAYANEFRGGVFSHSFLKKFDYHRFHAPVEGKVLEAKVIQGQAYLETRVNERNERDPDSHDKLVTVRNAVTPDTPGYQFVQTRGLVVLDSPIGLVAVLPVGMAIVSSVTMTAEKGVTLRKGEEMGYFQFGGSDVVTVYQAKSKVAFTAAEGVHYLMGMPVATAKGQH